MTSARRIAVIGSGVAGLSAAEKQAYIQFLAARSKRS